MSVITPVPKTTPSVRDLRLIASTPILSSIVERLVVRYYLIPRRPIACENLGRGQYAYKVTCAIINITDIVGRKLENYRYVQCFT